MAEVGSVLGDFELIEELGRGGMGAVYRARQHSLHREVAIKLLPPEMAREGQVAVRFQAEAQKMAQLSHPGIAQVYAVGEDHGTHYFAMQLLPGGSLEDRLRQGPVSQGEAVTIATEVAEALDYAHSQGITHRDIKPANIMFDGHGHAVVTDFGIAKAADDVKLTATGMAVGTPQYMAPEQARGNPTDGRADVYSLGAVLYEMLCGRPPFTGETPVSIAMKHMQEPPMPPRAFCPDLPEWLQSIVLRALAKEPADRFSTAREMAAALRAQASAGNTYAPTWRLPAQSPGEPQKVVQVDPSRSRTPLWAVVAICLLIGACLALAGLAGHNAQRPETPTPPPAVDSAASTGTPPPAQEAIPLRTALADAYSELGDILVSHKQANDPWNQYRAAHGNDSRTWHRYLVQNQSSLLESDRALGVRFKDLQRKVQALSVPPTEDASLGEMRLLLIKCTQAGQDRMAYSEQLMQEEIAGGDPSWGSGTPYGRAKSRFVELMGDGGEVGGKIRKLYDEELR